MEVEQAAHIIDDMKSCFLLLGRIGVKGDAGDVANLESARSMVDSLESSSGARDLQSVRYLRSLLEERSDQTAEYIRDRLVQSVEVSSLSISCNSPGMRQLWDQFVCFPKQCAEVLRDLTGAILMCIVEPLFENSSCVPTILASHESWTCSFPSSKGSTKLSLSCIQGALISLFEFVAVRVMGASEQATSRLGAALWKVVSKKIAEIDLEVSPENSEIESRLEQCGFLPKGSLRPLEAHIASLVSQSTGAAKQDSIREINLMLSRWSAFETVDLRGDKSFAQLVDLAGLAEFPVTVSRVVHECAATLQPALADTEYPRDLIAAILLSYTTRVEKLQSDGDLDSLIRAATIMHNDYIYLSISLIRCARGYPDLALALCNEADSVIVSSLNCISQSLIGLVDNVDWRSISFDHVNQVIQLVTNKLSLAREVWSATVERAVESIWMIHLLDKPLSNLVSSLIKMAETNRESHAWLWTVTTKLSQSVERLFSSKPLKKFALKQCPMSLGRVVLLDVLTTRHTSQMREHLEQISDLSLGTDRAVVRLLLSCNSNLQSLSVEESQTLERQVMELIGGRSPAQSRRSSFGPLDQPNNVVQTAGKYLSQIGSLLSRVHQTIAQPQ